ncbi:MAG: tRNA (5-methylaminomethyl-2-thiouridine)(34)-methyltransferase MnmD [Bacteroidia bacterium]|nr:tRNA (5-methylaminomethyl-2-thiouridine)(34)-methyltransferase MnmD [Bacteroidia bacterium]
MENIIELINTKEGIHTLHHTALMESYHSIHGSLQESMHVFIENGLLASTSITKSENRELKILEMGFGTGLNALLSYRENLKLNRFIHFTTVEAFPLPLNIIYRLNYFDFLEKPLQPVFLKMHECHWFETIDITPLALPANQANDQASEQRGKFFLFKIQADMLELKLEDNYDLVYYDAFSPAHQPELWTFEVLKKIYDACNEDASLVTYCAKGEVKRTLQKVGFKVETLKGPNGKREMIKAVKY